MARSPFGPLTETTPATRISEVTAEVMRRRVRELGCTSEGEYIRTLIELDCHGREVCIAKYRSYFQNRFDLASEKVAESDSLSGSDPGLRVAK